jgi:hypothetical protein
MNSTRRGREDGHELEDCSARKRKSGRRTFVPPPDSQIRARVENAPVPIRGLFYANPRLYIISIANLSLGEYDPDRV